MEPGFLLLILKGDGLFPVQSAGIVGEWATCRSADIRLGDDNRASGGVVRPTLRISKQAVGGASMADNSEVIACAVLYSLECCRLNAGGRVEPVVNPVFGHCYRVVREVRPNAVIVPSCSIGEHRREADGGENSDDQTYR